MKFFRQLILLLLSVFFPAAAVFAAAPRRIISLAPSVTKNLYLLGAQDRLIAVTIYCPERARREKGSIGTVLEPNMEKILSLAPDLVIASKEGNNRQTVEKLQKFGVTVYIMESVNNFSDVCRGFLALGKLLDSEARATGIIAAAQQKIASVQARVKNERPVPVFWEVGAQPLFTVSKNSFVNDFIVMAGGRNLFSDFSSRYPQVSREEVLRRDPEVIFMVTMGDVTRGEKAYWEKFRECAAVRNNRLYILNDSIFTDPTPTAIADGVEKVADILHPSRGK